MATKPSVFSRYWTGFALFLAMAAGMAVSTWQSEVVTTRERNWALKTKVDPEPFVSEPAVAPNSSRKKIQIATVESPKQSEPVSVGEEVVAGEMEPVAPRTEPLLPPIAGVVEEKSPETTPETAPAIEAEPSPRSVASTSEPVPSETVPSEAPLSKPEVVVDDRPAAPSRALDLPETFELPKSFANPSRLLADLELLKDEGVFASFAIAADRELESLVKQGSFQGTGTKNCLTRLESIRRQGLELAAANAAEKSLPLHLRCVHGISRRLVVWNAILAVEPRTESVSLVSAPIEQVVAKVRNEIRKSGNPSSQEWERFLLLNELTARRSGGVLASTDLALLQRISARAHSENLSDAQRAFLLSGTPRDLIAAIDIYLAEPLTSHELLLALEDYEEEPTQAKAKSIAAALAKLALSQDRNELELAEKVGNFYRSANVRVAIAESLINQLIPSPEASHEPVNDQLMGARVTGRSSVSTRLQVQLVPDQTKWRVGLEAIGNVASQTQAFHGPFTFFNQGWANYRARTTVGLGRHGFDMNQPTAQASSQTDLLDLQSDFDGIPLFGFLARSVARQQHANKQLEAEWEVEGRMARRIEQRLDSELQNRMRQAETEWTSRVAQPLENMRLSPTPIAFETTSERLIARYRVAGNTQLAAHTPRPLAPSDSVLSVQLHVSAINNFIAQLQLDGKTYKLEDLYQHLNRAMGSTEVAIPEDMPANIHVRFADEDALRMDVRDGQAELTVRLAEIRQGKSKWKNVQVRGRFVPKINGLNAELERTSYVELKGDGLKKIGGGGVILRMAFSSVLSRVSNVPLIHPKLSMHPQMQAYEIRQFTLEDGWIGLAVGPKLSTASSNKREERSDTARRPRSPMIDGILRR